jgi:hypothetical protein
MEVAIQREKTHLKKIRSKLERSKEIVIADNQLTDDRTFLFL